MLSLLRRKGLTRAIMNEDGNSSSEVVRISKANKAVEDLRVKLHKFLPSGRTIWTVVGNESDAFVDLDPNGNRKPYCSCEDFYFRVLSEKIPECYHLLAARKAMKEEMYSVVEFNDEELLGFLNALIKDIFASSSFR